MATRICAVRGLLKEASRAVDEGSPDADYLCSMAKLFASEEILKVCQHAVELHGGNGTMLDFGIEKLYRDATMFLHMDGTVDITRFKTVELRPTAVRPGVLGTAVIQHRVTEIIDVPALLECGSHS